ncbi:hypothetical protein [Acidocella sp.]|uniref:hypothetical protein n=1 Tax=Acidocella sp. TaxID=50710 RepID=UPI003D04F419
MKRFLLTALTVLTPALAQAAPAFLPTRDVAVQYTLSSPGQTAQNFQLSYDAASQLARVDSPNGYYVLANLPAGQAQMVVPALHAIIQAPDFSNLTTEIYQAENANFTPLGTGHYAGLDCRKYRVTDKNGSAIACLTPDGVILHFTGQDAKGTAELTATSVSYTPQPQERFTAPAGFAPLNLPPGALKALLQPPQ